MQATLGGGCFWCIEAVFQRVPGVERVTSGYAGGEQPNPDYRSVCTGRTGHAEVVDLSFDPEQVDFGQLLDIFFTIHDPTQRDRQGADVGPQYRSVIFCQEAGQEAIAQERIAAWNASDAYAEPLATEIAAAAPFYPAEAEHQDFYERNAGQPYCRMVIDPKLAAYQARFSPA